MSTDDPERLRARVAYLEARLLALQAMLEAEAQQRVALESRLAEVIADDDMKINKR